MAYDAFLKLDGLVPEQPASGFEVLSFSFGVHNSVDTGVAAGRAAVRPQPLDLVIVKKTDAASPALFVACATGKHFQKADLTLLPAVQDDGGGQFEYKVTFSDLVIGSIQVKGSEGGEDRPLEEVTLDYLKIEIVSDGNRGGFNFRQGTKT